jgi:ATPase subunit of ABC transporter with duplicated ATPase domains
MSTGPIGDGMIQIVGAFARYFVQTAEARRAREATKRAAQKAIDDERASVRQQQEWYEAVARQKARGHAGFASEAEARAALRGKGGRPSNLDGRKFW